MKLTTIVDVTQYTWRRGLGLPLALFLAGGLTACRQTYAPPAISNPNHYVVVDGFINISPNSASTYYLSRTRNLGDTTVQGIPELGAQFSIVGSNGTAYPLTEALGTGTYGSGPLTLDPTQKYSISIVTLDGQVYSSDPVPCKITPPIDSIFWRQPFDLNVYAGSHDPTNNTRYYRYNYTETWEHDAQLSTSGQWPTAGSTNRTPAIKPSAAGRQTAPHTAAIRWRSPKIGRTSWCGTIRTPTMRPGISSLLARSCSPPKSV